MASGPDGAARTAGRPGTRDWRRLSMRPRARARAGTAPRPPAPQSRRGPGGTKRAVDALPRGVRAGAATRKAAAPAATARALHWRGPAVAASRQPPGAHTHRRAW